MRIVSVMTGAQRGGAEFAAVELLDALIERGHEAVMLSDWEGIGRDTRVTVRCLDLGPKLSRRTWPSLIARWPLLRRPTAPSAGAGAALRPAAAPLQEGATAGKRASNRASTADRLG